MKFKFLVVFFIILCLCFSYDTYAAKGGFRSGSFSKSMSMPKMSPSKTTASSKSLDVLSKSQKDTVKSTSSNRSGTFGNSAKINKKDYDKEKNKFSKQNDKTLNKVYVRKPKDYNNSYYKNPPSYVYNTYPAFGGYDTLYLMFLLNSNPAWFYHHSSDPDIAKFKEEARELAKNNDDLKNQLNNMDSKIKELEDKNEAKNVNYEDSNFEKVEVKNEDNSLIWPLNLLF